MAFRQSLTKEQLEEIQRKDRENWFETYLRSPYKSPVADFDSIENRTRIFHGVAFPDGTGIPGIMDKARYPELRLSHVVSVVAEMDLARTLKHIQTKPEPIVIEKVVEVQKPLSKVQRSQDAGFNGQKHITTELDRYAAANPQKQLPNPETVLEIAKSDTNVNILMNETLDAIRNYTGPSHARTASRRAELMDLFNSMKGNVHNVDQAQAVREAVSAKIAELDRSKSSLR